jgi:hypothetical protein
MDPRTITNQALTFAFIAKATGSVLSLSPLDSNIVLDILAWIFAVRKSVTTKSWQPMILALMTFPKFRLGLGRKDADKCSPMEHIIRWITFRKVDLKLAPRPPIWTTLMNSVRYGLWNRHKVELKLIRSITGNAEKNVPFRMYFPLQRFDWTKPATMVVVLSDPKDVESVLTDREAFPTRGHTGFTDIVGVRLMSCEMDMSLAKLT